MNQFEEKFREITGLKHCVAVSSITAGLHLAQLSLGLKAGDAVLGSTQTFVGSVAPVKYCNAELVFVDSEPGSWNMDPDLLTGEIERLVRNPLQSCLPSYTANPAILDRILAIFDPLGIAVVRDSAESLGVTCRPAGKQKLRSRHSMATKSSPLPAVA